ncbi:hypothetical protein XENOCAPTIV_021540, partial [Xenoophorus captivus]
EEGEVQEGWILLEEEKGWKDDKRGPHEAEGPGHGVPLRLLRPFLHCANIPQKMLLAAAGKHHEAPPGEPPGCPGSGWKRAESGRPGGRGDVCDQEILKPLACSPD